MFKNLQVYKVAHVSAFTSSALSDALAKGLFVECGATQRESGGWVPPRQIAHAPLLEVIGGHCLLRYQTQKRLLPRKVVNKRVEEMAARIEKDTGRKPGKKQTKELAEQAALELLPQAFVDTSSTAVWFDPANSLMMIDTSSISHAEAIVTVLIKSYEGLQLHLVQTAEPPAACMSAWLLDGVAPAEFTLDRDCELKSADEMKSRIKFNRHALDIEGIRQFLQEGKSPTFLAMTYRERVSFVLTDAAQIRKIKFLDLAFEGRAEQKRDEAFDGDAALATGELSKLIPALIEALGGHHDFLATQTAQQALAA